MVESEKKNVLVVRNHTDRFIRFSIMLDICEYISEPLSLILI